MLSSFGVSIAFLFLRRGGIYLGTTRELLITVGFTTVCWLIAAFAGPRTDRQTLIAFCHRVHPFGPGWRSIR
jgi:hypothetical protein